MSPTARSNRRMNEWLEVMLEEIARKKKAHLDATEEHERRQNEPPEPEDDSSADVTPERFG